MGTKISALTDANALTGTELLEVSQTSGGAYVSRKVTAAQLGGGPCANVDASGGGATPSMSGNRGIASVVRSSAGVWVVTTSDAFTAGTATMMVCVIGGIVGRMIRSEQTGTTTWEVRAWTDAGVATDTDFFVFIVKA